jgi:flagellar hook protein FlgE
MVSMMIAQRAFSAQLRVIETADQMLSEVVARK